jgi:hypothetical protein
MKPEDQAAFEQAKNKTLTDERKLEIIKNSELWDMHIHMGWYSVPSKSFVEKSFKLIDDIQACCAHRDAQPAVAVNQRMRTALQEIANTVNYAQWYQETAEKALEDANHTEVALDKVAAVAVNEQLLRAAKKYFVNYCLDEASEFFAEDTGCRQEQHDDSVELREAIAAAEKAREQE